MNFLAHAHLSGDNDNILFGNFIADAVKGSSYNGYDSDIKTGILLHRQIDTFTDSHEIFKRTLSRIRLDFGKYSGVVVDIYYDHYLAKDWEQYHTTGLKKFTRHVYSVLKKNYAILPQRTKRLLPFLITQNWLYGYSRFNDLERVFYGMDRRTEFNSGMSNAVTVLKRNYSEIQEDFNTFYPKLTNFVNEVLPEIKNNKA
jgi:acyl carrier protein phosphodiesterase